MSWLEGLSPQAVSIGTAFFTATVTIALAGIKLLISRFDVLAVAIKDQGKQMHEWLVDHEEKDLSRHEENLRRFEKIAVILGKESH